MTLFKTRSAALREGRHVARQVHERSGAGCDVIRHAGGAARRAEGVVHMRQPLQGDPRLAKLLLSTRAHVVGSFHLLTTPSRSRRTGIRPNGYHNFSVPCGIYAIILWTPTLLVHHLLSQSARLTRRIDMRQARDVVSTQSSIFA
ncbi:unnamed protein product [Pieris brassicae]|uniref:Uncharacterized protein n=1 Tax=Pieris brassicae TaxID=7116 RepID=A0A9P0XGK8_PIEBR|nr:unnamed protein product [Pieris brassicae]